MTICMPHLRHASDESLSRAPPARLDPALSGDRRSSNPSAKQAIQRKLDWLDTVAADREVNTTTFKVAFVVAQHVNSRTGEAWPKQERVARIVGASETTVRASLKILVTRGHLEQGKKGARNLNKYRLQQTAGGSDGA